MFKSIKEALEEVSRAEGIRRADKPGVYVKPEVGLIVNYQGEYVKISKLSKNSRKVYFKRSHMQGESIVDISLLSYDEKSAKEFKNAFGLT
ncbi:hypothetical protein Ab1vBOLIVR5_gp27 [Agrobacterium phage OLIVR5]|uniref:Uncharacterized protein n=2 Tax=Caudoviricetes TaxID=2731619 RepID=A0A858MYP3_9CAUD|nr:hypothetical protein KNU99_gp027 [Agrobacterium phage OLIVR5]QIW87675.1 hypothetical protein Ab1vBOLIVR5_gp27 [Agrobacterium phage OLIVR5]QIW87934.1 hypothetical protein Ab1vBOLIVR6_gp27 [Agrobacterium phage OLIVR6]